MVISQNGAGHLQIHTDWPSPLKNKGVFFVKRYPEPLPESQDLTDYLACGDIPPNVLGMWSKCFPWKKISDIIFLIPVLQIFLIGVELENLRSDELKPGCHQKK